MTMVAPWASISTAKVKKPQQAFSRRARSTSRPAAAGPSASRSSTRPGAVLVAAVTDVRRVDRHSSTRSAAAYALRVQAIGTCTLQRYSSFLGSGLLGAALPASYLSPVRRSTAARRGRTALATSPTLRAPAAAYASVSTVLREATSAPAIPSPRWPTKRARA
jgi:hypothetical protein